VYVYFRIARTAAAAAGSFSRATRK
jgi:hypothetical protein